MGRPVLAFNHGGSVELVNENKNGILSKPFDIKEFANNIKKALSMSLSEREKLSKESIDNVQKKYLTSMMCQKTIRLYQKLLLKEKNAKDSIIKHGSLGDIILSMCSIFSVKNHFKNSKITILTEKKYYELFKNVPVIDSVKFDNRPRFYNFMSYLKLCIWFYKEKFDWVFDLQTSNRTNI